MQSIQIKLVKLKISFNLFKESNKAFYGYVRSKQKVRSHVAQLRKVNTLTGSDEVAANELSSFFTSVFVKVIQMSQK